MVVGRDGSSDAKEVNHTVVATARGVFDVNGGILESKETGTVPRPLNDPLNKTTVKEESVGLPSYL